MADHISLRSTPLEKLSRGNIFISMQEVDEIFGTVNKKTLI